MRPNERIFGLGHAVLQSARCAWIPTVLLPTLAQASTTLLTDDDLKVALHDVLAHGSLFDVAYVSDKLDLGLHVSRPQELGDHTKRFEAIPTRNPPVLFASTLEYFADVDSVKPTSSAHLRLSPRSCPRLSQWATEWGTETRRGMLTDAAGSSESLTWPGTEGITLVVVAFSGGGCSLEMSQTIHRGVTISTPPAQVHVSANDLARRIGDLLLSGDLRDYKLAARILDTEFIVEPDSQRNGLLYDGWALPGRVVLGLKPYSNYSANDSGWHEPPGFFAQPLHLTDRTVTVNLPVDADVVCLSPTQFASELKQRPPIREGHSDHKTEQIYSVHGKNLLTLSAGFGGGCLVSLTFRQVTDIAHSVGDPARFPLVESLDGSRESLTNSARHKIDSIVARLRSVSLGGIQITAVPGKHASQSVKGDLATLGQLVRAALKQKGINVPARSSGDSGGQCHIRVQPDQPAVCVDAWL